VLSHHTAPVVAKGIVSFDEMSGMAKERHNM
jgi:hypothetical protein